MLIDFAKNQISRSEKKNYEYTYICPDCGERLRLGEAHDGVCPKCGRGYTCYGGAEGMKTNDIICFDFGKRKSYIDKVKNGRYLSTLYQNQSTYGDCYVGFRPATEREKFLYYLHGPYMVEEE